MFNFYYTYSILYTCVLIIDINSSKKLCIVVNNENFIITQRIEAVLTVLKMLTFLNTVLSIKRFVASKTYT